MADSRSVPASGATAARDGLKRHIYPIVALAVLGLGYLGNKSVTPEIIDFIFGISDHVKKEMGAAIDEKIKLAEARITAGLNSKVDSGYSALFMFAPGRDELANISFHARKGQKVQAQISQENKRGGNRELKLTVDQTPLKKNVMSGTATVDLTPALDFDVQEIENIHTFSIRPVGSIEEGDFVLVKAVLVVFRGETGE